MDDSLPTPGLREWRCRRCKRLLLRHAVTVGTIEVLCERPRCKTLNVLVAGPDASPVHAVETLPQSPHAV